MLIKRLLKIVLLFMSGALLLLAHLRPDHARIPLDSQPAALNVVPVLGIQAAQVCFHTSADSA